MPSKLRTNTFLEVTILIFCEKIVKMDVDSFHRKTKTDFFQKIYRKKVFR